MNKFFRDFVCIENRDYKFKVGQMVASCLAGFIVGAVVASIIWGTSARLWQVFYEIYSK